MLKKYGIFLMLVLLISCCRSPVRKNTDPYFKWTDSYGREVSLPREPQRIISMSPSITEMLFMLNSGDKLVGITDFCTYPPETKQITKIGGLQNFNTESLIVLEPDVVIIGSIITKEEVEKIEKAGIPVIAIREEQKMEGIYDALTVLGRIVNQDSLAIEEIKILKNKMESLHLDTSGKNPPSVYYVVDFGDAGDYTAPNNSHIHEIITRAGGRNIGEDLSGWNISREYLFQEDPDFIFIRKEDKDHFCSKFPYRELSAVKNGRVYPIESGWIDIVSPRNFLAIEYMNKKIKNF